MIKCASNLKCYQSHYINVIVSSVVYVDYKCGPFSSLLFHHCPDFLFLSVTSWHSIETATVWIFRLRKSLKWLIICQKSQLHNHRHLSTWICIKPRSDLLINSVTQSNMASLNATLNVLNEKLNVRRHLAVSSRLHLYRHRWKPNPLWTQDDACKHQEWIQLSWSHVSRQRDDMQGLKGAPTQSVASYLDKFASVYTKSHSHNHRWHGTVHSTGHIVDAGLDMAVAAVLKCAQVEASSDSFLTEKNQREFPQSSSATINVDFHHL